MSTPRPSALRLHGVAVLLAALLASAATAPQDAPAPASTLTPFATLTGAHSRVTEARCERISTQDDWVATWLAHVGEPPAEHYDLYFNRAGVPLVDFARCMVVAVFDGASHNNAGYEALPATAVTVGGVAVSTAGQPSGGDVLVIEAHHFQTLGPAPDGGAQAVTPFAFFILPRTDATLLVQQHYPRMGGEGPGRIVERARFPALDLR
jgi:hypothetical protein